MGAIIVKVIETLMAGVLERAKTLPQGSVGPGSMIGLHDFQVFGLDVIRFLLTNGYYVCLSGNAVSPKECLALENSERVFHSVETCDTIFSLGMLMRERNYFFTVPSLMTLCEGEVVFIHPDLSSLEVGGDLKHSLFSLSKRDLINYGPLMIEALHGTTRDNTWELRNQIRDLPDGINSRVVGFELGKSQDSFLASVCSYIAQHLMVDGTPSPLLTYSGKWSMRIELLFLSFSGSGATY